MSGYHPRSVSVVIMASFISVSFAVVCLFQLAQCCSFPNICDGVTGLVPHPTYCAMYYDCDNMTPFDTNWEPGVRECPYPENFNPDTLKCESYLDVRCGRRANYVNACDYYANQCRGPHCRECSSRYPSCELLRDGSQPWIGREYTPQYVLCDKLRVVGRMACEGIPGGYQPIFDPSVNKCV